MKRSTRSLSAKSETSTLSSEEARRETARRWRKKNREKITKQAREWRRRNPDKVKARQQRVMAKRRLTPEGYVKLLLRGVRQRSRPKGEVAGGRGARVKITAADILAVWPKDNRCPILGTAFRFGPVDYRHRANIPSLDRIDSRKGYLPENIAVMSWRANTMKNDATPDEIQRLAKWMQKVS
jgi:hypothetical protein